MKKKRRLLLGLILGAIIASDNAALSTAAKRSLEKVRIAVSSKSLGFLDSVVEEVLRERR
jgi:gas vesicle protein